MHVWVTPFDSRGGLSKKKGPPDTTLAHMAGWTYGQAFDMDFQSWMQPWVSCMNHGWQWKLFKWVHTRFSAEKILRKGSIESLQTPHHWCHQPIWLGEYMVKHLTRIFSHECRHGPVTTDNPWFSEISHIKIDILLSSDILITISIWRNQICQEWLLWKHGTKMSMMMMVTTEIYGWR